MMNQPLISKKADGSYELSESGLSRAYMMTMQRLLVHYAQQALKTPPADAQALGHPWAQLGGPAQGGLGDPGGGVA